MPISSCKLNSGLKLELPIFKRPIKKFSIPMLMAYELLMKYVDGMLNPACKMVEPAPASTAQRANHAPLNCTASRTDVVELGYALHAAGFFNNGKASIKDIMNLLSDVLQVNLRNYSHTFFQIRERKTNVTKYIDELKTGLGRYLDQLDELK